MAIGCPDVTPEPVADDGFVRFTETTVKPGMTAVPASLAVNNPFQLEFTATLDTEPEPCHMQAVSSGRRRATTW